MDGDPVDRFLDAIDRLVAHREGRAADDQAPTGPERTSVEVGER